MKYIKQIIKKLLRKTDWRIKKIYRNKSYTNAHPKLELLNAMHDCSGIIHMGAHRGTEATVGILDQAQASGRNHGPNLQTLWTLVASQQGYKLQRLAEGV